MPNVTASGVTVRHAISRALATANLAPGQATYKVLSASADLRRDGQVGHASVFLSVREPSPLRDHEVRELEGWVNPDGEHPDMALVQLDDPLFVDVFPVTWDRWLLHTPGALPRELDPLCPMLQASHAEARAFAQGRGKRLPTASEFRALWGPHRFPWGERPDPRQGHAAPPRFGHVHEVGAHPPIRGLHDLGAWLWHWLEDGTVAGSLHAGRPGFGVPAPQGPVGLRCVQDVDAIGR